jgi:flavin-dependent thymidylate synthase
MTKEVQKWADVAMFKAEEIDVAKGPQVQLLSCNNDPLGTIASAAKMYKGESVTSLAQITDEERYHYLDDVRKNALAAPLEFVNFHFIISGVTRGFTHQMVRQRTATYTQESTRFAVKEDVPVGIPPSLEGTLPWIVYLGKIAQDIPDVDNWSRDAFLDFARRQASREQLWRKLWDQHVEATGTAYNALVNSGMPAEDARGLLPTNLLTRINYNTSLRGLLEHSGLRLCTQAQFEWRLVWMKILEAIREYGKTTFYFRPPINPDGTPYESKFFGPDASQEVNASWQFDELSKIFKPICYQKGSCQFLSDVDRACTIRPRVQAFASDGVPSSEWGHEHIGKALRIDPIRSEEWMLDPKAARVSQ